jgi:predicted  nucleic acid-binding Zn-ribbon protein
LVIGEDGFAHEVKTPPAGEKVECPHCGKFFFYEPKK